MSLSEAIEERRSELIEVMLATARHDVGTSPAEVRQFLEGFVGLLAAAAAGDEEPKNEYLATVIPAIRDGGMPLEVVLDGMIRVAMAVSFFFGREHLQWLTNFCADYTRELLQLWRQGEQ